MTFDIFSETKNAVGVDIYIENGQFIFEFGEPGLYETVSFDVDFLIDKLERYKKFMVDKTYRG